MKVLIVDSNAEFGRMVAAGLQMFGHTADVALTADEALTHLASLEYSMVVVGLPSAAAFLRKAKQVDVTLSAVVLSLSPSVADAVEVLRGGPNALAIDYIVKPEPHLIRRVAEDIDAYFTRLHVGELMVDRKLRRAYWAGEELQLSPVEHAILTAFAAKPWQDITYEELAQAVYEKPVAHGRAMRMLRAPLSRLRSKLSAAAGRDVIIYGYNDGNRLIPSSPLYKTATAVTDPAP